MKRIALFLTALLSLSYADNYVQLSPKTPMNALDSTLLELSKNQNASTAYYIDARTGKVMPIPAPRFTKPPKSLPPKATSKPTMKPTMSQITIKKEEKKREMKPAIPYEMQEERIELLR